MPSIRRAAACCASLLAVALGAPAAAEIPPLGDTPPRPEIRRFSSASAALAKLLEERPRVIAFGEYHQTLATRGVPSALRRFTTEMLPLAAPRLSDLVAETFVAEGRCGEAEKQVVADVAKTTERPAETEDEVVTLLKTAKARGVAPHILTVSCDDYAVVSGVGGTGGAVDYARLLGLIERLLHRSIDDLLARRPDDGRAIAVYGGALHNDLYPKALLREFTFGRAVREKVAGRYLEVDLYVPEYIERDADMRRQSWYAPWRKGLRPGTTTLIRRGPGSYIIVFARARR